MTSRWANAANETEAAKTSIVMTTMVDLNFASGHIYAHDSVGTLVFNGNSYLGVGQFGGINVIEEDINVIAKPIVMTLSGVDASLVTTAMTESYQGRSATIYIAILNKDTLAFIANPEVAWTGRMDYMKIDVDQNIASITLNCESRLRQSPRIRLQTDQDQQTIYPGDNFYNRLAYIPNARSNWGAIPGVSYIGPRPPPSRRSTEL